MTFKKIRNKSTAQAHTYGVLEDRKLMAAGAYTGFFDGNQITFDSGTASVQIDVSENAQVVMGDWNGDGNDTPGIFHQGNWILDQTGNGITNDDQRLSFGWSTDVPVAGDWDGDGVDTVGAFRDGAWYLDHDGDGLSLIHI